MSALASRIRRHPFLETMRHDHFELMRQEATETVFHTGEMIFRESSPASRFYLIEEGMVVLKIRTPDDDRKIVQTLGAGDALGWSWMFPPFAWHFDACAVKETTAIVFNGTHLLIHCNRDREFGYELMKRVAQMVIQRLENTRDQLPRSDSPMTNGS